ncbi:class C sortase [Microbacterium sp. 13-71-7]|uniref:class C sortase n=1 Tax=Microbacterium sp. 13-71-7 TaxID=1970399 RepID=UPI0025F0116A|nr:class C sortase [Microbacterium sp. 13-71-7]
MVTALFAFIGANVLTYSSAASWLSSVNQSQIVEHYQDSVKNSVPTAAEQLAAADRYNEALSSGAQVEANTRKPVGEGKVKGDGGSYWSQLSTSTGIMSRIQIPKIGVDLPVYHGTDDATLLKGTGHLEGTSLPVGGKGTLSVITGHRGLAEATMFTNLDQVQPGDTIIITTFGRVLTYKVFDTRVVEPSDTASLHPKEGRDLVTLITCTPLGINTHRILVTAERVLPTPTKDVKTAKGAGTGVAFPWWAVFYLLGLALIAVYVWWGGQVRRVAPSPSGGSPAPDAETKDEEERKIPPLRPRNRRGRPQLNLDGGGGQI